MKLDITAEDIKNIKESISEGGKIWENQKLKDFKKKIKTYNRYLQSEQCCYCRKSLADEFNMVIDIEHVLPQSKYDRFMFENFNLSVACKRCNMEIKKDDISFITDLHEIEKNPMKTELYKLLHPNLDDYFSHIRYLSKTANNKTVVNYIVINDSPKGKFTYIYFDLKEIEKESLNQAQGIKVAEKISPLIKDETSLEIQKLLMDRKK